MATYIPQITDYIPKTQPFQPDLNFYQSVLSQKQAQYKAGHDKLSNIYGTLLNSEMLREPNKEKRDYFFNQIEQDIQRISTVDLSLDDNVNSAYRIFQPMIDDQNIMKDMSWTKKARGEQRKSEALRDCTDPKKCGDVKWWKEGDEYLNHMIADFAKSDDETAMKFENPRFVPSVDVPKMALDIATAMKIDIKWFEPKGDWMIYGENGKALEAPLRNYLVSAMMGNPQVAEMYNVKGYLNRKNNIYANLEKFGGDERAAELDYLDTSIAEIKKINDAYQKETDKAVETLKLKDGMAKNDIKKGIPESKVAETAIRNNAVLQDMLDNVKAQKHYQDTGTMITTAQQKEISIDSKRRTVDGAFGQMKLSSDMANFAQQYALTHGGITKVEANPFSLKREDHKYRMIEMDAKYKDDVRLLAMRLANEVTLAKKKGEIIDNPLDNLLIPSAKGEPADVDKNAPALDVHKEMLTEESDNLVGHAVNYLGASYQQYLSMSKTPGTEAFGKKQLAELFPNGDPTKDIDILSQGKPGYWQTMHKTVQAAYEKNKAWIGDDYVKANLEKIDFNVTQKTKVMEALTDMSLAYNKKVFDYIKSYYPLTVGDNLKYKDADLMASGDDPSISYETFRKKYAKKYQSLVDKGIRIPAQISEGAKKSYDELMPEWTRIYNSNDAGGQVFNASFKIEAGGGVMSSRSLTTHATATSPGTIGHTGLVSVLEDFAGNPSQVIAKMGEHDKEFDFNDEVSDNKAIELLNAFRSDMHAGTNKLAGVTIRSHKIGGGDRNIRAYTLTPDNTYKEDLAGSKGKKGILFGQEGTVTLYMHEDVAKNVFAESARTSDMDILLNRGPVDINDYAYGGGALTIAKVKGDQGGYQVNGYFSEVEDGAIKNIATSFGIQEGINTSTWEMITKNQLYKLQQFNFGIIKDYNLMEPYIRGEDKFNTFLKEFYPNIIAEKEKILSQIPQ